MEDIKISKATKKNWVRLKHKDVSSKLKSRANKTLSEKNITPKEYLEENFNIEKIRNLKDEGHSIEEILFSFIIILTKGINNKYLKDELKSWNIDKKKIIRNITEDETKYKGDILGFIYQSLLTEGEKNIYGSYYTPKNIVNKIIEKNFKDGMKFIDPCCGTGQFLLNIESTNPENLWGADIDKIAVKIARINIMLKYPKMDFKPNIFNLDSIKDNEILPVNYFDLIATNPPWGSKNKKKYSGYNIKSGESFSYFIEKGINFLKKGGKLSYILPESILNVKNHSDIRKIILSNEIKEINELGNIFNGVFTKVIILELKKEEKEGIIQVNNGKNTYTINQCNFKKNKDYIFSIHTEAHHDKLFEKIYSKKCVYLNNKNCIWSLGIVTGNNKEFISDKKKGGYIPIYTGKEVKHYFLEKNKKYLYYKPEKYQQISSIENFKSKPKLIYKFISKKLFFALDTEGIFTLNSANIIIPKLNYPIKVILALFNSEIYQEIFQKKFNSIKVLKSHIQELPLPILEKNQISKIENFIDNILETKNINKKDELDNYIKKILTK